MTQHMNLTVYRTWSATEDGTQTKLVEQEPTSPTSFLTFLNVVMILMLVFVGILDFEPFCEIQRKSRTF